MGSDATFEPPISGNLSVITGSGVSVDASIFRTGAGALKIVATSGAASNWSAQAFGLRDFRAYVRITVLPSAARVLLGKTAASELNVRLNPDGTLELRINTTSIYTTTKTLTDTTRWYCIEIGGSGSTVNFRLDQSLESTTTQTTPSVTVLCGSDDAVAATYTAYYDDLAEFDGLTDPHPGAVALLVPTSLNAAGGWVEGDGAGTAGMAAAVATRPPPGLASANETSATNIESPTNSATDDCDMNMTTYVAAGVSGQVNGTMILVRHGEDIATGTKSGATFLVSNPAQVSGETSFSFGNDAGAHGAEKNNWRWTTTTVAGAVVLATAPVLRVGKRTATTRVVCVDFMGIYVDYTPVVVPARRVHQAVQRAASY